ncbi:MAG TPA: cytochrome c [Acetobacteraceae bacterium]|nr:cytochrome c [Acetobacteraceae bacterium]
MRKGLLIALLLLPFAARAETVDGQAVFDANCGLCHQTGAVGVPGQFPRLAGRVGVIAAHPEGRRYLAHVLLNGMSGMVSIDGATIVGYMPSFATRSDAEIAAVLRWLSGLGGGKPTPFTAAEIAAERGKPLVPSAVHAERAALVAAKVVP